MSISPLKRLQQRSTAQEAQGQIGLASSPTNYRDRFCRQKLRLEWRCSRLGFLRPEEQRKERQHCGHACATALPTAAVYFCTTRPDTHEPRNIPAPRVTKAMNPCAAPRIST